MSQTFSAKDPAEVVILSIDFTKLLNGATVEGCTFSVLDKDGQAQASMLSGAADTSAAPVVRQKVQAGTAGLTYLVKATITTSDGRTLVGSGLLPVRRGA